MRMTLFSLLLLFSPYPIVVISYPTHTYNIQSILSREVEKSTFFYS